ncbi:MAG: hypothetical protein AAF489_04045 [Bacteroidota bacterium]
MVTTGVITGILVFLFGWLKFKKFGIGKGFIYNLIMAALTAGVVGFAVYDAANFTSQKIVYELQQRSESFEADDEEQGAMQEEEAVYNNNDDTGGFSKAFGILLFSIILIVSRIIGTFIRFYREAHVFERVGGDHENSGLLSRSKFLSLGAKKWTDMINGIDNNGLPMFYTGLRNLSQQSIYLVCCSTLIFAVANDGDEIGWIASILNFGLFFILDDWQIMHEYSQKSNGNLLKKHQLKNWGVNLLLVISCVAYLFTTIYEFLNDEEQNLYDLGINLILLVLLILFVIWRLRSDFNVYEKPLLKQNP